MREPSEFWVFDLSIFIKKIFPEKSNLFNDPCPTTNKKQGMLWKRPDYLETIVNGMKNMTIYRKYREIEIGLQIHKALGHIAL